MANEVFSAAASRRRIELGLLLAGALATAAAAYWSGLLAAAAAALGTALSWINFRWLKQGLGAIEQVSRRQQGSARVRIPVLLLVKFFARTALILVVLYVSLAYSLVPAWPLLAGLFTPVAGVIGETVYQLAAGSGAAR
ncbi:MAG TPA: ATP synthase subunit I [Candidatus Acidoferrales bacterium]|nr:ATP synthase subunit I [Candidatus Acidoferrales bacterium]